MEYTKRLLSILIVFACVLSLAGCGKKVDKNENNDSSNSIVTEAESETSALVIIAGRHANANTFSDEMLDTAQKLISDTTTYWTNDKGKYCGEINTSIIISDGAPSAEKIVSLGQEVELTCEKNTEKNCRKTVSDSVQEIVDCLGSRKFKATEPEVDLLAAIGEAKVILDSKDATSKTILILDTGISTSGFFDMNENQIMMKSADDVINEIDPKGYSDLTGIKVCFLGLGNVAGVQADLRSDSEYRNQLVAVWTGILKKCNAELVDEIRFSESSGNPMMYLEISDDDNSYPYVSPVEFEYPEPPAPPEENVPVVIESIRIPTATLQFNPNEDTFVDDEKATKFLKKTVYKNVKKYLEDNENNKIYIVGSIAQTDPDVSHSTDKVSEKRANKIASILKKFGINAERMVAIDAGTTVFSWRNAKEFDSNGNRTSETDNNMEKNRVVMIVPDCCSDEVNELVNAGYVG